MHSALRGALFYLVVIVSLRILGKRQIGQLEPSELVLAMLISDLAAEPMLDSAFPFRDALYPIGAILVLSLAFSWCSMKNVRLRRLLCGSPATVIRDGRLCQSALRKCRLTLDELLEELRVQGVSDIMQVKYAILETNGSLSVLLYPDSAPVTPSQLARTVKDDVQIATLLISGGGVILSNLKRLGLSRQWLSDRLSERGIHDPHEVFFFTLDTAGTIVCIKKDGS